MVRVFETEVPDGQHPHQVAERMFEAFNIGEDELAQAYRARGLRSMSVGDVARVGEVPLACASVGWDLAAGEFNETMAGAHGSVPLPHCSYCHFTGDDTTLEPFNPAGNLACRDARACSARMIGSQ
jgi:hypothetical protein